MIKSICSIFAFAYFSIRAVLIVHILNFYTLLSSLKALNKYFIKYKWRLLLGILFVTISNVFAILPPSIVRKVLDSVYAGIQKYTATTDSSIKNVLESDIMQLVMVNGLLLIAFAILRGIFMFFMRQTIIVMSRHIEYDMKNEIYAHYQQLSLSFYKQHSTGDLMSRISEDVSRVRMYIGPAIMYGINLIVLTSLCIFQMVRVSPSLSLYVLLPLPLLAFSVFYVNKIVNRKSEKIQAELSNVTSCAQETYAGIRVIKSFVQEEKAYNKFSKISEAYKKSAINLATTEAIYFPSMNIFIGISILLTILIGGWQAINNEISLGNIAEFIIYITMLTFPISAIGFTANMIQRAAVSQRRINEFLETEPDISNPENAINKDIDGDIVFEEVSFTYPHTGIQALKNINIHIKKGEKVAIIGKTGSGKSTLLHLLLRMYDVDKGAVKIDGVDVKQYDIQSMRKQLSYVPQDVFLFSDTIANNIAMDVEDADSNMGAIIHAATLADVDKDIQTLSNKYQTVTGERGVMLSGGQKQRISIARALYKDPQVLILDDSLSAVDTKTEKTIQNNISRLLHDKTAIIITHRIFKHWNFDQIIILGDGAILEQGTHESLMEAGGYYAQLYSYQTDD